MSYRDLRAQILPKLEKELDTPRAGEALTFALQVARNSVAAIKFSLPAAAAADALAGALVVAQVCSELWFRALKAGLQVRHGIAAPATSLTGAPRATIDPFGRAQTEAFSLVDLWTKQKANDLLLLEVVDQTSSETERLQALVCARRGMLEMIREISAAMISSSNQPALLTLAALYKELDLSEFEQISCRGNLA